MSEGIFTGIRKVLNPVLNWEISSSSGEQTNALLHRICLASLPYSRVLEQWSLPRMFRRSTWVLYKHCRLGEPTPPIVECRNKVLEVCTGDSLVTLTISLDPRRLFPGPGL